MDMMSPEMRMMETQCVSRRIPLPLTHMGFSFKVFDYTHAQRRSYYHPATPHDQTTSSGTGVSTSTAVSQPEQKHLISPQMQNISRPGTPSDRTGLVSRTSMDVEAQILDGGVMANLGGRDGWKPSEIDEAGAKANLEMRATPSPLPRTPLRATSTRVLLWHFLRTG